MSRSIRAALLCLTLLPGCNYLNVSMDTLARPDKIERLDYFDFPLASNLTWQAVQTSVKARPVVQVLAIDYDSYLISWSEDVKLDQCDPEYPARTNQVTAVNTAWVKGDSRESRLYVRRTCLPALEWGDSGSPVQSTGRFENAFYIAVGRLLLDGAK